MLTRASFTQPLCYRAPHAPHTPNHPRRWRARPAPPSSPPRSAATAPTSSGPAPSGPSAPRLLATTRGSSCTTSSTGPCRSSTERRTCQRACPEAAPARRGLRPPAPCDARLGRLRGAALLLLRTCTRAQGRALLLGTPPRGTFCTSHGSTCCLLALMQILLAPSFDPCATTVTTQVPPALRAHRLLRHRRLGHLQQRHPRAEDHQAGAQGARDVRAGGAGGDGRRRRPGHLLPGAQHQDPLERDPGDALQV